MRLYLGTILVLLASAVNAQFVLKGQVKSAANQRILDAAVVTIKSGDREVHRTATNQHGWFELTLAAAGSYQLTVDYVGFERHTQMVNIANRETTVQVWLSERNLFLEPLEVRANRAGERAPFAKQNIYRPEIEKINTGQDIPFLLNQTPSVVVNSDAGNGIGYTGIRIRGTDASRINMTINGIPYNDAESQGIFFVNLPDISSSVGSFQIQRGVGTSSNGAGAFGATLNLSTNEFNEKPYAELNNSFGSFNTWKHTVRAGTGLINNHFTFDARLSKISTDGYIDRAFSDLESFYLSGAYIAKNTTIRLNIFSGQEQTYQAWYGIDSATLRTNRRFNPAGMERPGEPYPNQTDNYQQHHYQLFLNQKINSNWSFNTAFFLVNGRGYYEQYRRQARLSTYGLPNVIINGTTVTRTDLVRQLWLDNAYYGQIGSLHYRKQGTELTIGGGWNTYEGDHFGTVIWAQTGAPNGHRWYDLPALKKDANIYAKLQQKIADNLEIFLDGQFRTVHYRATGFRDNPKLAVDRRFDFFNPKAGITWFNNKGWTAFASYALGQKEPNRDDFEAGVATQPRHEQLHDFEMGLEKKGKNYSFAANLYYMIYRDQLVLTGMINDVGAYTRVNVPHSFRRGIELQGAKRFSKWMQLAGNITFSQNKIREFTEFIDDYDNGGQVTVQHRNTDIAYSPAVVSSLTAEFTPVKEVSISLVGKYVGRQYLDNTQNKRRSLDPFFVQDARINMRIPNKLVSDLQLILQVNNVFNRMYEPNGYTFSYFYLNELVTENYYFPMAGTNFMVGVNVKF